MLLRSGYTQTCCRTAFDGVAGLSGTDIGTAGAVAVPRWSLDAGNASAEGVDGQEGGDYGKGTRGRKEGCKERRQEVQGISDSHENCNMYNKHNLSCRWCA